MPDGITLDYLAVQATCTLDNTGSGKAVLSPGAGQFWLPTIAHVGTASTASPTASCSLHVGATGITDYTTQVDFTFSGVSDSSTIVSGMIVSSGESVTAFFLNGKPGDTGYIRVIGVSSSAAPTIGIEPGFPGAKFTGNESTVTIAGQPINVNLADIGGSAASAGFIFVAESNKQMYANQSPVTFDMTVAAGTSSVIVPAAAGVQLFLHDLRVESDTPGQSMYCQLQDTSGHTIARVFQETDGTPAAVYRPSTGINNFHGAPVTTGLGIQITNPLAVAVKFIGYLTYSL